MTFKEALKIVHDIDKEKWFSRYQSSRNEFVMIGCEGRFMRRKDWVPGKYVLSTTILNTPSYVHMPEQFMCTNWNNKEEVTTFDWGETLQNDWEVYDLIPGNKPVLVDPSKNKYGLWSKYQHKFTTKIYVIHKEPYLAYYEDVETDEWLPYWNKEKQTFEKVKVDV